MRAVRNGALREAFSAEDFQLACPGFGDGTYQAFLWKHRKSNPGGNSELFAQVSPGRFRLIRPFLYGA